MKYHKFIFNRFKVFPQKMSFRNRECLQWIGFAILLNCISFAQTGAVEAPFVLKKLMIKLGGEVVFSDKMYRRRYQGQNYSPLLLQEIQKGILSDLKRQGYHFARIDSHQVLRNQVHETIDLLIYARSGPQLLCHFIEIQNLDSLDRQLCLEIDKICQAAQGKIYTGKMLSGLSKEIVGLLENRGYPLARVQTKKFELKKGKKQHLLLNLTLKVIPGAIVQLSYLRLPPEKEYLGKYLRRLLRFRPEQPYQEERVRQYERILRRQEFMKIVRKPLLGKDREERYFLALDFEENPSTTLDGIIGYLPPVTGDAGGKGTVTGVVNIGVRNLGGGGRKVKFSWQKQDQYSDEFQLMYREPFAAGLPFHSAVGVNRLVKDSTFTEWRYFFNVELPISEVLSAFGKISSRSVLPDSLASRQLRLPRTESIVSESGIHWDFRDDRLNPTRGVNLEIAFNLNRQKNRGPAYLLVEDSLPNVLYLSKIRMDLSIFIPTFKQQLIANHFHWEILESRNNMIRLTDQIRFGGAASVRGYREAEFYARQVLWSNTEYRFWLGPRSRFFLFTDNAYYTREIPDKKYSWLNGYGIGIRFASPLGALQVDLGMERGAPFREGKLHFRIINNF